MRRFGLAVVAAAVLALLVTFATGPRAALACSGSPLYNPLQGADAVAYGHFDRIAHDSAYPVVSYDPSLLTIGVDRTLVGEPLPGFIEVHADVPLPNAPIMCPQFDREDLVGRHAVVALYRGVDGSWSTNRAAVWFEGDSHLTVATDALARLLAPAAPPTVPVASISPASGGCDNPFVVKGEGWPATTPIDIQINGGLSAENGTDVVPISDGDGSFALQLPLNGLTCPVGEMVLVISAPAVPQAQPLTLRARVLPSGETMPVTPAPPDAGSGVSATGLPIAPKATGALLLLAATLFAILALAKRHAP